MNKLLIAVKSFLNPLPNPKDEVKKYQDCLFFNKFTDLQLELLISIVYQEATNSRKFSLFIRPSDLETEITFWIAQVGLAGPNILHQSSYSQVWNKFTKLRDIFFEKENEYYFNLISNSKPKITSSNAAFQCHQEAVQAKILDSIVHGKFQ